MSLENHAQILDDAKAILQRGGVLLHRADTVWGLICDARNEEAVQRVINIKGRPAEKGFIVLVKDDAMLEQSVKQVPEVAWDILDAAVDPLTIVYPQSNGLAQSVCAEDGSIAIRIVKDDLSRKMIERSKCPLLSTSANVSGDPTPYTLKEVSEQIKAEVDKVISRNKEISSGTKPSAIIKIGLGGEVKIIRS